MIVQGANHFHFCTMKKVFLILLSATAIFTSCKKDKADVTPAVVLPTVTTTIASSLSITGASSGGNISSEGSAPVTARGVVWDVSANPTVALTTKTVDGTGSGSFSSAITGLAANTTYHARAYATSSAGTAYGNDITFTTTAAKLYICGTEWTTALGIQQAKVWVDGASTILSGSTESFATGMAVTNAGDIYVSGSLKVTQWRATYWKNGTANYLTDGTREAGLGSIFINGSDVYACGGERNASGVFTAKYWKNGTETVLGNGTNESSANGIFVSGADVYVAGYETNAVGNKIPKYWKNGTAIAITTTPGVANSVLVSGSDVYITGTDNSSIAGLYWKNTAPVSIPGCSLAFNCFLSGADLYISGTDDSDKPAYWKNGTKTSLSTAHGDALSICVLGPDVFAAGTGPDQRCKFWKNGVENILSANSDFHNKTTCIIYK